METARFICTKCGHKFAVEVFEEGEAEDKGMRGSPVSCPKCGGQAERR